MILIEWDDVQGAHSYNTYRSPTGLDGTFVLIANLTGTNYNDGSGTITDFYRVISVDKDGIEGTIGAPFQASDTTNKSLCLLSGTICDVTGHPDEDVDIRVRVLPEDSGQVIGSTGTKASITEDEIEVNTNALGQFDIYLIIGATVELSIRRTGYMVVFVVPKQAVLLLEDVEGFGTRKNIANPF